MSEPMFDLAVCSEMVFVDLPLVERIKRISELGFLVEIWSWWDKDLDALAATGATFSSMTGYVSGNFTDPEAADELLRTAQRGRIRRGDFAKALSAGYVVGAGAPRSSRSLAPAGVERFLMIKESERLSAGIRIVVVENWLEEVSRLVPTE